MDYSYSGWKYFIGFNHINNVDYKMEASIMKKIMTVIFLISMVSILVSAEENQKVMELKEILPLKIAEKLDKNASVERIIGLENALLVVKNENARERLTLNLQKWQNRTQYKYDNLTIIEDENNKSIIYAEKKGKILGIIPYTFKDTFYLRADSTIEQGKRGILSKLFNRRK